MPPSAYSRRNLSSIPAPLEPDSDSDFNPRLITPPPPTKTSKRRTKSKQGKKRDAPDSSPRRKRARSPQPSTHSQSQNPLLEFFDLDLNLHSASEDEDADLDPLDLEEAEGSETEPPSDNDPKPTIKPRTNGVANKPTSTQTTKSKPPPQKSPADGDSSGTEPDTSPPPIRLPPKRKSPSSTQQFPQPKRPRRMTPNDDDNDGSETEPDTDTPPSPTKITSKIKPLKPRKPESSDSSSTEPDSEPDTPSAIRPNLPLPPGTPRLGPLTLSSDPLVQVPGSINTYLREYQRDGVRFFWERYLEVRGGLLGDDMGLGKTIQVLAFLSAVMCKHGDSRDIDRRRTHVSQLQDGKEWKKKRTLPRANEKWPTCLIVAPKSVVGNWEREFETWGYFEIGMYTGPRKEREDVLRDFKMGRLDVLISGFETAVNDIALLDDLSFSLIIIDEVHRVKNPSTASARAFRRFACQRRFGLTGTMIQNNYMEMWTILDWTSPGRLGTKKQWKGYVVKPLTVGQSKGASEEERLKALSVAVTLRDKLLPHFFIRRTKEIIKHQLPEKTDQVVFCPLSAKQREVYKNILATDEVQNLIHKDDPCSCGSKQPQKSCCVPFESAHIFKYMWILIKLSNHLALILPAPNDTPEQTARNRELAEMAFPNQHKPKYGAAMLVPEFCGKWNVLQTLLADWRKDRTNKVLIFTQSVKLLDMLDFYLKSNSYGFVRLEGATEARLRMPIIDQFHQDPDIFIFLISTMAGGTGLNLTGANKVVIFDPHWNPANDLQAMDRAYRYGQLRDVAVFRLLGAGSIEELIYARQLYKQQQMAIGYEASVQTRYFQGVQGDSNRRGELFGLRNIFRLHEDTYATKMAIEEANIQELDWALAHMGSGKSKKLKPNGGDWIQEAESKASTEESDLKGLGALLFDDDPPDTTLPEEDEIKKTLNSLGVKYSHHNDHVLQPSRIEEERALAVLQERKRRAKKARQSGTPTSTAPTQWPPIRAHHKRPPSPRTQLANRQEALIGLGYIKGPVHMSVFAQEFVRKSKEEQKEILGEADHYIKENEM